MERMPLGVSRLDRLIGGGAPTGSVVLAAGDSGAGAREFCYTSAVMNGLAIQEADQFDLHYGSLESSAVSPSRFTTSPLPTISGQSHGRCRS